MPWKVSISINPTTWSLWRFYTKYPLSVRQGHLLCFRILDRKSLPRNESTGSPAKEAALHWDFRSDGALSSDVHTCLHHAVFLCLEKQMDQYRGWQMWVLKPLLRHGSLSSTSGKRKFNLPFGLGTFVWHICFCYKVMTWRMFVHSMMSFMPGYPLCRSAHVMTKNARSSIFMVCYVTC
jgi:hypothetical protein